MPNTEESSRFLIDNGTVGLEFDVSDDGSALENVVHVEKGAIFHVTPEEPGEPTLWQLEFRNEAGEVVRPTNEHAGDFTYDRPQGDDVEVVLHWNDIPLEFRGDQEGTADVHLTIRLPSDGSLAYWEPRVVLSGSEVTLWQFSFPTFTDVGRDGGDRADDHVLIPHGWGAYLEDPVNSDSLTTYENTYPSGVEWTMQFMAFENEDVGLYLAHHDPHARPKDMTLESKSHQDTLSFSVVHHPDDKGKLQSEITFGGPFVTGVYSGNWYDAAELYRDWAVENASWTARGPIVDRADIPDWFKRLGLWWLHNGAETELLDALDDRFSVPAGVHWYNWHEVPFDTDYPDFFPARDGWAEAVRDVQDEDFHVMPYINGRLADSNSRSWTQSNLADGVAKRASARFSPKTTIRDVEIYGRGRQLLSPMCPATDIWQSKLRQLVKRLGDDVGVHAVYIDQIAATPPPLCHDPDHGHPTGGGAYNVKAYQHLLSDLIDWKSDAAPMLALTTECNAEPFMGWIGGYLMWHSARSEQVPLYAAVYGDYCMTFGRQFHEEDLADDAAVFTSKVAQLFTYGAQLGWMGSSFGETLLEEEYAGAADYLDETAQAVQKAWEYVSAGRRLRDPESLSSVPTEQLVWDMHQHGYWEVELPVVMAAVWTSPAREGIAVAATNWTTESHDVPWRIPPSQLPDKQVSVQELLADQEVPVQEHEDGGIVMKQTIDPRTTLVFEVTPD